MTYSRTILLIACILACLTPSTYGKASQSLRNGEDTVLPPLHADCLELEEDLIFYRAEQELITQMLNNITRGEAFKYAKNIGIEIGMELIGGPIAGCPVFQHLYSLMPDAFAQATVNEIISTLSTERIEGVVDVVETKLIHALSSLKKYNTTGSIKLKLRVVKQTADATENTIKDICQPFLS